MKVLEIILPVLVMILLGMACKRLKLLDQNGINNMKLLVTQIMLPVAIFHALATAEYNKEKPNSGWNHVCNAGCFL